jgi:hypothetical protein
MTNEELHEIVIKLSKKVELLENEITQLKNNNITKRKKYDISELIPKPNITLSEWMDELIVKEDYINDIFEPGYGVIHAFKRCILENINKSKTNFVEKLPFYKHNKNGDLFIYNIKNNNYDVDRDINEREWSIFNITTIELITKCIWLKFLKIYMENEYKFSDNEDIRDLQKQKIMSMRIHLYEIEKNRRELIRWFIRLF